MADIASEYRIITTDAGWSRSASFGWIRVTGRDRARFLHALLTSDIESIATSAGAHALYLTPQGRMVADLRVLNRGGSFLIAVAGREGATQAAALTTRLDASIFAEDARVEDESASLATIVIVGRRAAAAVAAATRLDERTLLDLAAWSHAAAGARLVVRTDETAALGFLCVVPRSDEAAVIAALERAGASHVSDALIEALRIDAARPEFGVDMTTDTIPLEAGLLDRAISQTKGCYVGQEVIVRVLHRGGGRVAKVLVKIEADADDAGALAQGARLMIGDADVGSITSAAISPRTRRPIALAYVKRDHAEAGTRVAAGDGVSATIVARV